MVPITRRQTKNIVPFFLIRGCVRGARGPPACGRSFDALVQVRPREALARYCEVIGAERWDARAARPDRTLVVSTEEVRAGWW